MRSLLCPLTQVLVAIVSCDTGVAIYYKKPSNWGKAYIHYSSNHGAWNPVPGELMAQSHRLGYTSYYVATVPAASDLVFVTTDGAGQWDNNRGKNYHVSSAGAYSVDSGVIKNLHLSCDGSPPCSGHGTCHIDGQCQCDKVWGGEACDKKCPGGSNPCSGHGHCSSAATCVCDKGWATCGATDCATNVDHDANHCGACNVVCKPHPNDASATCTGGKCVRTCKAGFQHCSDGACLKKCPTPPLPGCQTYHPNDCTGNDINTPAVLDANRWQTPRPGSEHYEATYGGFYRMTGWPTIVYNADRTKATVTVNLRQNPAFKTTRVTYAFNKDASSSPVRSFSAPFGDTVHISVTADGIDTIDLEPVNFVWQAPAIALKNPHGDYRAGQKGAVIELFMWPHKDVAKECATIGAAGWLGVKISPVQEQVMATQPFNGELNPWYFAYQPVSYHLDGRMGSRSDLIEMIAECRKHGVRVYADAVINHMTGCGNDANWSHRNGVGGGCTTWPGKQSSASHASPYYTECFDYTANPNTGKAWMEEFPRAAWGPTDFHCQRALNSWTDPLDLDAGWLTGLTDLHTGKPEVQNRIADYLTQLMGAGFSGFRIDAAKHISPPSLAAILARFRHNMGGALPNDFFTYLEVLTGGERDMLLCDGDSGYNYGPEFEKHLKSHGFSQTDVDKVKIWFSAFPNDPDGACGKITRQRLVIENDDSDQQNPGSSSRDMHDKGVVLVKTGDVAGHRHFEEQLFNGPNGVRDNSNDWPIRLVLSSYWFAKNGAMAPPDGKSDCRQCKITCQGCKSVEHTPAFVANACGYTLTGYTRVHRDVRIINAMRGWMGLEAASNKEIGLPESC